MPLLRMIFSSFSHATDRGRSFSSLSAFCCISSPIREAPDFHNDFTMKLSIAELSRYIARRIAPRGRLTTAITKA